MKSNIIWGTLFVLGFIVYQTKAQLIEQTTIKDEQILTPTLTLDDLKTPKDKLTKSEALYKYEDKVLNLLQKIEQNTRQ